MIRGQQPACCAFGGFKDELFHNANVLFMFSKTESDAGNRPQVPYKMINTTIMFKSDWSQQPNNPVTKQLPRT
jgi:hypothetical protein